MDRSHVPFVGSIPTCIYIHTAECSMYLTKRIHVCYFAVDYVFI